MRCYEHCCLFQSNKEKVLSILRNLLVSYRPPLLSISTIAQRLRFLKSRTGFLCWKKSEDTENLLERLIYCNQQSLLTTSQKIELGNYIWNNGNIRLPKHWRPTLCLDLPAQPKEEEFRWLRETIVSQIVSTSDILSHTPEYRGILWSLSRFSLDRVDAFDSTQITTILLSISNQLSSLLKDIDAHAQTSEIDNFSITITYEALHTLWLLLSSQNGWTPTENDKKL